MCDAAACHTHQSRGTRMLFAIDQQKQPGKEEREKGSGSEGEWKRERERKSGRKRDMLRHGCSGEKRNILGGLQARFNPVGKTHFQFQGLSKQGLGRTVGAGATRGADCGGGVVITSSCYVRVVNLSLTGVVSLEILPFLPPSLLLPSPPPSEWNPSPCEKTQRARGTRLGGLDSAQGRAAG